MGLSSKKLSPGKLYCDLLTPDEQVAYRLLLEGLRKRSTDIEINLRRDEMDSIKRAIEAIHLDYPDLFYVEYCRCKVRKRDTGSAIKFDYLYTPAQSCQIERMLSDAWAALEKKLSPQMPAKKQYRIIALEIASMVRYLKTGDAADYSVVNPIMRHTGVCEGVSKLFLYYCNRAGLPAWVTVGKYEGVNHSWNRVWLRGKEKYLDLTVLQQCPFLFRLFPGLIMLPGRLFCRLGYVFRD